MNDKDWSSTGDEAARSLAAMWSAGSAELIAIARRFDLSLGSLAVLGEAAAGGLGALWTRVSGDSARTELAEIGLEVRLLARALAELDRRQRRTDRNATAVAERVAVLEREVARIRLQQNDNAARLARVTARRSSRTGERAARARLLRERAERLSSTLGV